MKLDIQLQAGSLAREHQIELIPSGDWPATGGRLQFVLDGESTEADWAEITPGVYSILLSGRSYDLQVTACPGGWADSASYEVSVGTRRYHVEVRDPRRHRHSGPDGVHEGPQEILAPMPGKIVKILVAENQEVDQDEGLLVIEAMKMQNELRAPRAGRVERVYVKEGAGVEAGFKLIRLA